MTQASLKAIKELAKLEAQRGNPEYLEMGKEPEDSRYGRRQGSALTRGQEEHQIWHSGGVSDRAAAAHVAQNTNIGKNRRASNEMCIFLIFNISSLQSIPVNMIAYRSQYGSANPTAIIAPAIAATLVAIVYCKVKDRGGRIL